MLAPYQKLCPERDQWSEAKGATVALINQSETIPGDSGESAPIPSSGHGNRNGRRCGGLSHTKELLRWP